MKSLIIIVLCLMPVISPPTSMRYFLKGTVGTEEMKLSIYEEAKDGELKYKAHLLCTFESLKDKDGDLSKTGKGMFKSTSKKNHSIAKILIDNYKRLTATKENMAYSITPDEDILVTAHKVDGAFYIIIETDKTMPVLSIQKK